MILFLAHYPEGEDCRDGMAQRILAIDRLFQNEERTYLALSIRRFWTPKVRRVGKLKIIQCQCLIGFPLVVIEAIKCDMVYVHSIANALCAIYLIPWLHFVIDVHGVVPEEEFLAGHKTKATVYGWIEAFCLKHAMALVCVTKQMGYHLKEKYLGYEFRIITLPIMPLMEVTSLGDQSHDLDQGPLRVIYSGGVQPWQNVDQMIEVMALAKGLFTFEVYTQAVDEFRAKLDKAGVTCQVESLDKIVLIERYKKADFGFLLRDPVLVNRVACPTKLGEYMQFGVIPIVLQPDIGDMKELGFAYLTLDDFCKGQLPTKELRRMMCQKNWAIMNEWENIFHAGALELSEVIKPSS